MNRDTIKYIAMFTMLLNHIGNIFLEPPLSTIFIDIGYFTAISMCYFLVEGYGYTSSRRKYALRLFAFALLSQIPYSLAFAGENLLEFNNFNMLFTLLICFLIIHVCSTCKRPDIRFAMVFTLVFLSAFCDWPVLAPAFTLLFLWAGQEKARKKQAWIYAVLGFGLYELIENMHAGSVWNALARTLGAMAGPALAAFVILFLYNGKRAEHFRRFSQWFFYLFYPIHLMVLGIVRYMIQGQNIVNLI